MSRPIRHHFKTSVLLFFIFLILAIVCINFFDKPLALFMHAQGFDQWHWLSYITERGILALDIFAFIMLCFFPTDKLLWKRILLLLIIIAGGCFAIWVRRRLGVMCARSWPNIWANSGVYGGLIGDGQFGFHFFKTSSWKGSFPSGHSVEMSYICCMMYLVYHRFKYKYLWWLPLIAMVIGQVVQNFHFLGDCLAGIALGVLVAYCVFAVCQWLREK